MKTARKTTDKTVKAKDQTGKFIVARLYGRENYGGGRHTGYLTPKKRWSMNVTNARKYETKEEARPDLIEHGWNTAAYWIMEILAHPGGTMEAAENYDTALKLYNESENQ